MSVLAKRLREECGQIVHQMRELNDLMEREGRDYTAEEQSQWDRLNADLDAKTALAEKAEAGESRISTAQQDTRQRLISSPRPAESTEQRQPEITPEHRALALQAWCMTQHRVDYSPSDEQSEACKLLGVNPRAEFIELRMEGTNAIRNEQRALSGINPTAGGFLVPDAFVPSLERALLQFGGPRQVATIIRTASGEDLLYPTSNDTGNSGAIIQENIAVTEQDVTVGSVRIPSYTYSSKMVRVPVSLLQDSAIDLASLLGSMLGERIGRATAAHFTTGTGAGQPKGIITAATSGVTAASATAIAADELISLVHSVDPAYRMGTGVAWMMHDTVLQAIRKLKDGNGQYLWQPGLQANVPGSLLGYRVVNNQHMASSIASAGKTVAFGDFSKYLIRDVGTVRMRRLVERYADQDQEAFLGFMRCGGNLIDAGTNPVKFITQA